MVCAIHLTWASLPRLGVTDVVSVGLGNARRNSVGAHDPCER
jgi:hypothetical protein